MSEQDMDIVFDCGKDKYESLKAIYANGCLEVTALGMDFSDCYITLAPAPPHNIARLLNERSTIEQVMHNAAGGLRPMPDAKTLGLWALALGTPKSEWSDVVKAAVKRPEVGS